MSYLTHTLCSRIQCTSTSIQMTLDHRLRLVPIHLIKGLHSLKLAQFKFLLVRVFRLTVQAWSELSSLLIGQQFSFNLSTAAIRLFLVRANCLGSDASQRILNCRVLSELSELSYLCGGLEKLSAQ